jgi:hypothetical protein
VTRNGNVALLDRLPIRVRPVAGETVDSYIRRLAHANHLRPSLLQVYVRNPALPTGPVRPERLAAVSGSTLTALTHALVGLPKPRGARDPRAPQQPSDQLQAARKARLFAAIRADAEQGLSMRQIQARHRTGFRTVRQALASPTPPPRKRINRPISIPPPVQDAIDALLDQDLTIWEIWTRVVDEHAAEVSYGIVRAYARSRQPREATTRAGRDRRDSAAPAGPIEWHNNAGQGRVRPNHAGHPVH